jgi:hypothetical protein
MIAYGSTFMLTAVGLGRLWASEHRGGRLVGFTLVLVGAFTAVDAAIWML